MTVDKHHYRLHTFLLILAILAGMLPRPTPVLAIENNDISATKKSSLNRAQEFHRFQNILQQQTSKYRVFLPLTITQETLASNTIQLQPGVAASLAINNGAIQANFSSQAVKVPAQVRLAAMPALDHIAPGMGFVGRAFQLHAWELTSHNALSQFPPTVHIIPAHDTFPATSVVTPNVTLSLSYSDADVWGIDLRTLALYTRENANQEWQRLPSKVDRVAKVITADVSHFSEFVAMGRLAVVSPNASILRLVLDPDDDVGFANWNGYGSIREITYNIKLSEALVQRFQDDGCQIDIIQTRDSTPFVSTSTRANVAQNFGPHVMATLAFNSYNQGYPWGFEGDGGSVAYARSGNAADSALANALLDEVFGYTKRRSTRPVLSPILYNDFNNIAASYTHLETLFLSHNYDWPVIDQDFGLIVDGVYVGLRRILDNKGLICLIDPDGSGPRPPALPARPSAERLQRLRDLGYQNYQRYGGDPVSFSTGNHILQRALSRIPGRGGLDIDLTLTYNSQDQRGDILGYGWTLPYNVRLQRYTDESVSIVLADGRTYHYEQNGTEYSPPAGVYDSLKRINKGWIWTSRDHERTLIFEETITGLGVLKEWRDRRGNTLTFTHDLSKEDAWKTGGTVPRPALTSMIDATGRTVTVIPDAQGRISAMVLPDSRRFDFGYDQRGDLVTITDANTPVRGTHTYEYDDRHRITKEWDPEGIFFLENSYDDRDRVTEQYDAERIKSSFNYDPIAGTTTFTDNLSQQHVYGYDTLNRVTAEKDPQTQTLQTEYDPQYNISKRIDARGNPTIFKYDLRGNLIERQDPIPVTAELCLPNIYSQDITRWEYRGTGDNLNLPTAMVNALGKRWEYEYDVEGNLTRAKAPIGETSAHYNEWGQLDSFTNANRNTTRYFYDKHGNLEKTIDPLLGETSSRYDSTGRERSYTDANKHTVRFEYNGNDQITRIIDPKLNASSFRYDRNDLLLSTTDRAGTTREFRYDKNLKLVGELDQQNGVWKIHEYDRLYRRVATTDRNGNTTRYFYDPIGQLTDSRDPTGAISHYEYDADGHLTSIRDAMGGLSLMEYDSVGRLIRKTDAAGSVEQYCYDAEDRLVRQSGPRPNQITSYAHDDLGRITAREDALAAIWRSEYDLLGNLTATIDPLGNRTDLRYDPLERLIETLQPTLEDGSRPRIGLGYDAVGNTTVMTSPLGFAMHMWYDENDNLEKTRDPLGAQIQYGYDAEDRPLTVTDANGNISRTRYDPVGNPLAYTNGAGETIRLVRDANYNIVESINPLNHVTLYDYDARNDLLRVTDALGSSTSYQRDALGRVSAMLDALGRRTGYDYDPVGRLTSVTDALLGRTQYAYNEGGDLIAITDANNHTTRMRYDALGQLTGEVNPIGNRWQYAYDAAGRLAERIDALGRTTFYENDSNNRLVGIRYSVAPAVQAAVRIAYDLNGNETQRCNAIGCISTRYDALNRPVSSTDWAGRTVGRSYDGAGNLVELLYPNAQPVRYEHDQANRLVGVTLPNNRTSLIKRDGAGQLEQIAHPNGTQSSYSFDEAGRLTGIDHRQKAASTAQTAFAYTLDRVGNRTATRETRAALDGSASPVSLTRSYDYDKLNRLSRSRSDKGSDSSYLFDAVGNRQLQTGTNLVPDAGLPALPVKASPVDDKYRYNEANQLVAAGQDNLSYNANGERQQESHILADGRTSNSDYSFDLEGRLVGVNSSINGKLFMQASYEYDGYGRRVRKTVSYPDSPLATQVTTFLYDGLEIIGARIEQGSASHESYYYLMPSPVTGLLRPFAMQRLNTRAMHWMQSDGLDSIVALSDEQGKLDGQMIYGDYGQILAGDAMLQLFTYTAQDYDAETGLLHFYARYYDAARGVWLSQDTYRGRIAEPGTLHRYGYVGNNAIDKVDLYGFLVKISLVSKNHDFSNNSPGHTWITIEGCNEDTIDNPKLCNTVKQHSEAYGPKPYRRVAVGVNQIYGVRWNIELNQQEYPEHNKITSANLSYQQQEDLINYINTNEKWVYLVDGVCTRFAREAWKAAGQQDPGIKNPITLNVGVITFSFNDTPSTIIADNKAQNINNQCKQLFASDTLGLWQLTCAAGNYFHDDAQHWIVDKWNNVTTGIKNNWEKANQDIHDSWNRVENEFHHQMEQATPWVENKVKEGVTWVGEQQKSWGNAKKWWDALNQ